MPESKMRSRNKWSATSLLIFDSGMTIKGDDNVFDGMAFSKSGHDIPKEKQQTSSLRKRQSFGHAIFNIVLPPY